MRDTATARALKNGQDKTGAALDAGTAGKDS